MYFVVVVMALVVCGLVWFFAANGIQKVQEALNPMLASDQFASEENWTSFNLGNNFMNYFWILIPLFIVLGLAYYGYVESQRRI